MLTAYERHLIVSYLTNVAERPHHRTGRPHPWPNG